MLQLADCDGDSVEKLCRLERSRLESMQSWNWCHVVLAIVLGAVTGVRCEVCPKTSVWVGYQADLSMLQHQLRGRIEIVDDCSFKVSNFDMLPGEEVYWWASLGEDVRQMIGGKPASSVPLIGSYSGNSLHVTLDNGTSWNDMSVLGVWSKSTFSDYGHILLEIAPPSPPPPPLQVSQPPPVAPGPVDAYAPNSPPSQSASPTLAPGPAKAMTSQPPPPPALPQSKPQPTTFDACADLVPNKVRLRWTLVPELQAVELGVEGAVDVEQYLAFGWAKPGQVSSFMLNADVAVLGYDNKGLPFAEDYFIDGYSPCSFESTKPKGVCPDWAYHKQVDDLTKVAKNNVELLYSQRVDGITLVRFRRPLNATDPDRDHTIDPLADMKVVFAVGPYSYDTRVHHIVPHQHNFVYLSGYGDRFINLSNPPTGQCIGPLNNPIPDAGETVVAPPSDAVKITAGDPDHYPNPPSSPKVFFIDGKESPTLKVERGVPVKFSIEAGHSFPLYITSDPIGGHTNTTEVVYWGGADTHGVPVTPFVGNWTPNRTTPDLVYYQSYTDPKMGWKVQVVDSSLADAYPNSTLLADGKVRLHWALSEARGEISFAASGEWPKGWLAIGFGSGMKNGCAYVAYRDNEEGVGKLGTYQMEGRDARLVHPTGEELKSSTVIFQDGHITFHFTRDLNPLGYKCKIINPQVPLQVIWAYGTEWTSGTLMPSMMHTRRSSSVTLIDLRTGDATVEHPGSVFVVHGFMMFLAWGVLMPSGVLSARYLKHVLTSPGKDWFSIHLYTQTSGIAIMLLGLLFAVGELQGFSLVTAHAQLGLVAIGTALWQPLNAYFRPPKPHANDERPKLMRVIWQVVHQWSGRVALVLGGFGMLTGLLELEKKEEVVETQGLMWSLTGWFMMLGIIVCVNEYRERAISRKGWWGGGTGASTQGWPNGGNSGGGSSSLPVTSNGGDLEGDTVSLLPPATREAFHMRPLAQELDGDSQRRSPSRYHQKGEIQLGPL